MNMMSVLLGATGLLLVAALILSMGSMNGTSDSDEIKALRAEIAEINAAERELALHRTGGAMPLTPVALQPDAAAIEEANRQAELAAENAALREELAKQEEEVDEVARKASMLEEEANLLTQRDAEKTDKESRRARIIQEALLIATVTQYSAPDGFAVISIQRPDNAQEGAKLAIRRNSGIVGQLQISSLYPGNEAVADPLPGTFLSGSIDIQPGDELIIPPL